MSVKTHPNFEFWDVYIEFEVVCCDQEAKEGLW